MTLHSRENRLFAVACARRVQHFMTDKRSLNAVDMAERYANGQATEQELAAAYDAAVAASTRTTAYDTSMSAHDAAAAHDAASAASAAASESAHIAAYAAASAAYAAYDAASESAHDAAAAAAHAAADAEHDAAAAKSAAYAAYAAAAAYADAAYDAAVAARSEQQKDFITIFVHEMNDRDNPNREAFEKAIKRAGCYSTGFDDAGEYIDRSLARLFVRWCLVNEIEWRKASA